MDANMLLEANPRNGRVGLAARVALAQHKPALQCPIYLAALDSALIEDPPPFDTKEYADTFKEASDDAQWMAISLITNAEREGDGATRLWSLAACSDDMDIQRQLKSHAVDESRHALFYLTLLDLTFPEAVAPPFRLELEKVSPKYSMKQDLFAVEGSPYARKPGVDDFVQMNIAELRTAIHHLMQRAAIARHCSPDKSHRITSIQNSLLRDELNHVAYTAALIERLTQEASQDDVSRLFHRRLEDFNEITTQELAENMF